MGMEQAWLLPAIPALTFVLLAMTGRWIPRGGDFIAILAIAASFGLVFPIAVDLLDNIDSLPGGDSFSWLEVGDFELRIGWVVDEITLVMLFVVTFVALMVQLYSVEYMKGENRYFWFYAVLSLFAAAMLTLVLADNLLLLYIGWELVGLCSFLLIGFYYDRRSAAEASKKAFVTTRVGDVGMLIGIILLWREAGTFNIQEIIHHAEEGGFDQNYLIAACLLLFMGPMGKSAQFPLHVWLPDAMEGPTPVSALIHAATMVVAGVYLIARMLPMYEMAPGVLDFILVLGVITAFVGAIIAVFQTDIKKVVAYSTISNLGFMFVALGTGAVGAAMFHLMTHAFFKALLFLGAGSVIHATHEQEVDKMGGLWRFLPITGGLFLVGSLANSGIFPLSGFWSKDEVLVALEHHHEYPVLAAMMLWVFVSGIYGARLFILTFMGKPRDRHVAEHAHEPGLFMLVPMLLLGVLSVIAGFVILPEVAGWIGFPGFLEFIYLHEPEEFHFNVPIAVASSIAALLGILLAWWFWGADPERAERAKTWAPGPYNLAREKFYLDDLYQAIIDRVILAFARIVAWFDRNVVNDTGIDGPGYLTAYAGHLLKFTQTGKLPNYALITIVGVIALAVAGILTRA